MEPTGLAALGMQFVTGMASAAGSAAATEVSGLVRNRLSSSQDGDAALAALDEDPAADERQAAVESVLAAALDDDREFALRLTRAVLAATAASPSQVPSGPVTQINHGSASGGASLINFLVHGDVKGGTIQVGPVSAPATPGTRRALLAMAVVLLLIVGLGVYGATQMTGGQPSAPAVEGAKGQPADPPDRRLASEDAVMGVLPDLGDLPTGWTADRPKKTLDRSKDLPDELRLGEVQYLSPGGGDSVLFTVTSHSDEDAAQHEVDYMQRHWTEKLGGSVVNLPQIGSGSAAVRTRKDDVVNLFVIFKSGPVTGLIRFAGRQPSSTYENAVGNAVQPLLERIKQAQRGDRPTARLTTLSLT
ncbi:hypothetical protein ACFWBF_34610 [Streptomyces sp. NPDC060028]|uniref:hypothetical protein n=1 Tax=Streptomyces sp. NPDC060028 TaxID=3347041 RepID=UPI00368AD6EC